MTVVNLKRCKKIKFVPNKRDTVPILTVERAERKAEATK